MVSFGQSDDELKKALSKYKIEWDDNFKMEGQGRFVMTPDNGSLLRLWNYPESCEEYGTLAHEIFHAVDFILRRVGITLSDDSHEAYAYLIGYLTKEIYKRI